MAIVLAVLFSSYVINKLHLLANDILSFTKTFFVMLDILFVVIHIIRHLVDSGHKYFELLSVSTCKAITIRFSELNCSTLLRGFVFLSPPKT